MKLRAFYTIHTLKEPKDLSQDSAVKKYDHQRVIKDFEGDSPAELKALIIEASLITHPWLVVHDKTTNLKLPARKQYAEVFGICEARQGEKLTKMEEAWKAEEVGLFSEETMEACRK